MLLRRKKKVGWLLNLCQYLLSKQVLLSKLKLHYFPLNLYLMWIDGPTSTALQAGIKQLEMLSFSIGGGGRMTTVQLGTDRHCDRQTGKQRDCQTYIRTRNCKILSLTGRREHAKKKTFLGKKSFELFETVTFITTCEMRGTKDVSVEEREKSSCRCSFADSMCFKDFLFLFLFFAQ